MVVRNTICFSALVPDGAKVVPINRLIDSVIIRGRASADGGILLPTAICTANIGIKSSSNVFVQETNPCVTANKDLYIEVHCHCVLSAINYEILSQIDTGGLDMEIELTETIN